MRSANLCVRQLLAHPLMTERGAPEAFDLIGRRREPIAKWFDYYCGRRLTVEPRLGYVRLVKVRATADPTRPARRLRSGRAPFDRCTTYAPTSTAPVRQLGRRVDIRAPSARELCGIAVVESSRTYHATVTALLRAESDCARATYLRQLKTLTSRPSSPGSLVSIHGGIDGMHQLIDFGGPVRDEHGADARSHHDQLPGNLHRGVERLA